jgi:hypothetical protein
VARTPWGDPDLQGTYTNANESGIPMERPADLAGRGLEDVTPQELTALMAAHRDRIERTAQVIGWMISDPPDGKIPATTEYAKRRAAAVRAARRGGDGYNVGPFDSPKDLTLYVRCITRGVPGSTVPSVYGCTFS